ncbi:MAG: N-acetyltransferase [Anaerolineae bacterium]
MTSQPPLSIPQLRALYDQDQRRNFVEPDVRREDTTHTIRQINLRGTFSFLLYADLTADNAEQVISDEIAYFESIGHDFEWKTFSHDALPDLVDRLRARGFETEEPETIMILDMNSMVEKLRQPITHDIRRITDSVDIDPLIDVASMVFGEDLQRMGQRLKWELSNYPDYISLYVAYVDGIPVASARAYFPTGSPFASLWGGGTLEAYRGRGVYTALVAARVQEALSRDRRFLTIDASPMSRPIVEKLGFVPISVSTPCQWTCRK